MTTPSSPGGRSPIWIAGVALLGVGVLSGVIGLIGLGTGGDDSTSAAPTTSESAPPPASSTAAPPPSDGAGTPGVPGTSPLTPGAPGTPGSPGGQTALPGSGSGSGTPDGGQPVAQGGTSPGSGSGSESAAARLPVRVYNNSTIGGLAEKAAEEFRRAGYTVTAVRNYPSGIIPTTTVYYRAGTAEKASADEMARRWGMRSEARFAGIQDATPGLIVIVTKDFRAA